MQPPDRRRLDAADRLRAVRQCAALPATAATQTQFISGSTSQLPLSRTPPQGPLRRVFGQFIGQDMPVELSTHWPHMRQSNRQSLDRALERRHGPLEPLVADAARTAGAARSEHALEAAIEAVRARAHGARTIDVRRTSATGADPKRRRPPPRHPDRDPWISQTLENLVGVSRLEPRGLRGGLGRDDPRRRGAAGCASSPRDRHPSCPCPARMAARSTASWKRCDSCTLAVSRPRLTDHLRRDVAPGDDDQRMPCRRPLRAPGHRASGACRARRRPVWRCSNARPSCAAIALRLREQLRGARLREVNQLAVVAEVLCASSGWRSMPEPPDHQPLEMAQQKVGQIEGPGLRVRPARRTRPAPAKNS